MGEEKIKRRSDRYKFETPNENIEIQKKSEEKKYKNKEKKNKRKKGTSTNQ